MPPETDPIENIPVLTDPQNWASRSHQELYAAVHNNNDPGQAGHISSDWGRYGSELTESARAINAIITSSESKWTGAAADGARAAMKKLGDWVDETARTAVEVGNKVAEQGRVMEAARAQMPAPVQFDWNKAAAALAQPGTPAFVLASADIAAANNASRAAHDQAVNVMTNMETSSRQIDTSTPTFKPPFNPNTGQVEQPVMAMPRSAGAPTLGGVESLMSTSAQGAGGGTAAPPAPTGTSGGVPQSGGANAPAAAYTPSAPGYTPPAGTGGGSGGGGGYTPQMPGYNPGSTNVAAAYTPTAPGYTPPASTGGTHTSGSNYTPQFPTGGTPYGTGPASSPQRPNTNIPKVPVVGKDIPNPNYTPQNPNSPKGMTPAPGMPGAGGGGGGGGGASSGMKPGAMPNFGGAGGGAGAFGGAGAGAGGGSMQPGGSAGVQGQAASARPGMPMGATAPGAAGAAGMGGAPMGGAPGAGGKGDEDKEHRTASYVMGGDLFEVPGENLPPSVIGGAKPKKQKGAEA